MLETATTFNATTRSEPSYKSWEASGRNMVMRMDPEGRTAGPIPTFGKMVRETALTAHGNAYAPSSPETSAAYPDISYERSENDDSYSFGDIIDIINPLQHLPVIGTLYRQFTGDTIKPISNIIGGAIFGGPVGAVSSVANVVVKDRTGKDIGENALSLVGIESKAATKIQAELSYDQQMFAKDSMAAANLYERSQVKSFSGKNNSTSSWNV